ncbi:MAG TPA: AbrB/MazE/SpoVT family DNA-binding domain-containing protein, partial [Geminicoccus sp.]|nr:AbrB/MazE/SpoVT family DNA-binding domain-containing protein [Geminicoccus sp.]
MDVVKLGSKGQVSIPSAVLARLGLAGGRHLIVETTEEGAILLRPAGIYPVERYSDERLAEFEREADGSDDGIVCSRRAAREGRAHPGCRRGSR